MRSHARSPRRARTASLVVFGLLALASAPAGAATVYDLTADWSDSANPNGPWAYREGTNLLPHVDAWQGLSGDFTSAQPAWARFDVGTSNLPCIFRSSATVGIVHDWQTGDVVCHTTDGFNGIGSGLANVTWTSPVTGVVAVTGAIWMGRDIGRSNHWSLAVKGVEVSSGDVASGDPYSRAAPMDLAAGSGGPAALSAIAVGAGDVIQLTLSKTSTAGDYACVRLQVTLVQPAGVDGGGGMSAARLDAPADAPLRQDMRLRFALPRDCAIELAVYDVNGRRVEVLADGAWTAGEHVVTWDARVSAGLYFLALRTPGERLTRRVVVLH